MVGTRLYDAFHKGKELSGIEAESFIEAQIKAALHWKLPIDQTKQVSVVSMGPKPETKV